MKTIVIIAIVAIVVAIGILTSIVTFQQSEISDIRRQEYLESSVIQCNTIIVNVNYFSDKAVNHASQEWQRCMDEAMNLYGNSFQKENWEQQKQQLGEDWLENSDNNEKSSNFDLEAYWALKYDQITEPIEKQATEKQLEKEKQINQEKRDSCSDSKNLIECLNDAAIPAPKEEKPICLSPNYRLTEYTVSFTYHHADRNHNGFYCVYLDPHDGEKSYVDDEG